MRKMKESGIKWIGDIPEAWWRCRIKNYCLDVFPGATPQSTNPDYWGGDINWIPSGSCHDCRINEAPKKITKEGFDNSSTKLIPANTALVAMTGATCGCTGYLTIESCANQSVTAFVEDKTKCNSVFLWYALRAAKEHLLTYQTGGAQSGVNVDNCKNIFVPFVSIDEQTRIALYLDEHCAYIDDIIEKTKKTIDEYKKLKQALIVQAVTKGVHGNRVMKDTGESWIGKVPADWNIQRISSLYEERHESGNDMLPILTVSINTGVSDRELSDEEKERAFVRSEDKTKYARVYPGDLTYNMMRAWQGAFGAVRVDGMVSPAYVIAKPKTEIDSRYMEALLRTPSAMQEMKRYSYGIADFRMRLYWGYFKNIKVCIPPLSEQKEIADYIDAKSREIDRLIEQKEKLLEELDNYKKAMIYEYVTGKREVM